MTEKMGESKPPAATLPCHKDTPPYFLHSKSVISRVHIKAVSMHIGVAYSLPTFVNNKPGLKYQILKTLPHPRISQGTLLVPRGAEGRKFSYTKLNR